MTHMHVVLQRPELEEFIDEQVKAGHFASPDAAIEAAVEQMMRARQDVELDDETADAINRAEAQIDRGEGTDFKLFAAEMRKKLASR
jgi:Arc/MetJ-type ribon-helix-helix transcriptional regulator